MVAFTLLIFPNYPHFNAALFFLDIPGHLQMDVLFIHWLYFVVHIQHATSVVEPFESNQRTWTCLGSLKRINLKEQKDYLQ